MNSATKYIRCYDKLKFKLPFLTNCLVRFKILSDLVVGRLAYICIRWLSILNQISEFHLDLLLTGIVVKQSGVAYPGSASRVKAIRISDRLRINT